jgi:putative sterol carrier protein
MARYLTQEWCDLLKEEINKSAAYEASAKTWEGDFYFVTEPFGPVKEPAYIYCDLYHGKCRTCEMVTDPDQYKPAFVQTASYNIWKLIITKKLDSTMALMTKQSKLTGDMAKVMRYTKASNELTNCTLRVPTEWLD